MPLKEILCQCNTTSLSGKVQIFGMNKRDEEIVVILFLIYNSASPLGLSVSVLYGHIFVTTTRWY